MSDNKQHLFFDLQLETISPLHIGSGDVVSAMGEYLPTAERILFPNQQKLMAAIRDAGKLTEYVDIILNKAAGTKTYDILDQWGIDTYHYGVERELPLNRKTDITGKNDILHLQIKNGNDPIAKNRAFLPGSSLKGAIRNTLIFYYLLQNKGITREIESRFREALNSKDPKNNLKKVWQIVEQTEIIPPRWANALRLTDTNDIPDQNMVVEQVIRRSFGYSDSEGFDYLLECIERGTEINTTLTVYLPNSETNAPTGLRWKDITEVYQAINAFSKANLDFEKAQIEQSKLESNIKREVLTQIKMLAESIEKAGNTYAIMRLGKGKTKLFQTILLALDKSLRLSILDLFKKDGFESLPQSRVLTALDNQMLGWVKITQKVSERPGNELLVSNSIDTLVVGETELDAYFLELKQAEIHLNGRILKVQMINKAKQNMATYSPIRVLVKQLKNNGEINQVELIQ